MIDLNEGNFKIFLGLYTALERTQSPSRNTYYKMIAAQHKYFRNQYGLIESEFQETANGLLEEAMYKFNVASYFLETMWGVHHYLENPTKGLPESFDFVYTNETDNLTFILSSLLDQSLYSWRSFLDFYLKYLLHFTTGRYIETASTASFRKNMQQAISSGNSEKAESIWKYIRNHVFDETYNGENEYWGDLLRSLRDKTTHKKLIKPTLEKKTNQKGYDIFWPQINKRSYPYLVQWEFENNAYKMLLDLFEILYEFPWVTGPFKPNTFE
jgi:hypothetical protein